MTLEILLLTSIAISVIAAIVYFKDKTKLKGLILGVTLVPLAVLLIIFYNNAQAEAKIKAKEAHYANFILENEESFTIETEYGTAPEIEKFEELTYENEPEISKEVGEHVITYEVKDADDYQLTLDYTIKVTDTKAPEITGKFEYSITEGESFTHDNIEIKATDPVDGEVKVEFDKEFSNEVGNHEIIAKAVDKNGNETTQAIKLTVKAKPVPVAPKPAPVASNPAPVAPKPAPSTAQGSNAQITSGFNFRGYHFETRWFKGTGTVPVDSYVYRWESIPSHYLIELYGTAGGVIKQVQVGDRIVVEGKSYIITRRQSGISNDDSTGINTLISHEADLTFQTCDGVYLKPGGRSTLTIWWANAE